MRIVSLIPSGTDFVAALGLQDHLVGVSHECDHAIAAGLPVVTASNIPRTNADGTSLGPADIDREVVESVLAGTSLYRTHPELLHELAPDIVLTQDVCDVCAVNAETAACDLPPGARMVMLQAVTIAGLHADIASVASAAGVEDRGVMLSAQITSGLAALSAQVTGSPAAGAPRRTVLTIEWGDPPFLGGHWVPELVDLAGGRHLLSSVGDASRRATWDEIAEADPDIIVFLPCGYGLDAAVQEARALLQQPVVATLRAVREGRFWATNATELFSRCTPGIVDAATTLAAIIRGESPDPSAAVLVTPST